MNETAVESTRRPMTLRRVAVTTMLGTTLEWYDFFIYSTAAALIFASQYFPNVSGPAQTMAALSTVTVGYFARPFGSLVFGHFGDRIGRKRIFVVTMLIMGLGTIVTGMLPTYDQIGIIAPIILVTVRFLQGVAIGGEWGGALLTAFEHAPSGKRGLYGSFPMLGAPLGFMLSTLVFLIPSKLLSEESFNSWGWRIPFILSIALVFVGVYTRRRVTETPEFERAAQTGQLERFPVLELLRKWWRPLLLGGLLSAPLAMTFYIYSGYVISYGSTVVGMNKNDLLVGVLIGSAVMAAVILPAARLSDRIGRKKVITAALLMVAAWAFPAFWLINTGSLVLFTVAVSVGIGAVGISLGAIAALLGELFSIQVRFTGSGTAYMLSGLFGTGPAPAIATGLLAATGGSWSISLFMIAWVIIGLVCLAVSRPAPYETEPHAVPTEHASTLDPA